jgi:mRNA interferase RelE/StbE
MGCRGGSTEVSRYKVYTTPRAFKEIKALPGNIRQRVRRAVKALADDPRPSQSKVLTAPEIDRELWRLSLDRWRIIYTISESDQLVDVLAIRKRPPYDYGDLESLLKDIC